jgi:hypothetical protein
MAIQIIGPGGAGFTLEPGLNYTKGLNYGLSGSGLTPYAGLVGGGQGGIVFAGNGAMTPTTIQHGLSQATFGGTGSLSP